MIIGLHHPAIVVPDLELARQFYCEVFEFEPYSESEWDAGHVVNRIIGMEGASGRFCMLKGNNTFLELFQYSTPASNIDPAAAYPSDHGIRHLAFEVEDVREVRRRLQAHGGSAQNEPVSAPGGPVAVYCRDPFGNLIELAQPAGRMANLRALTRA